MKKMLKISLVISTFLLSTGCYLESSITNNLDNTKKDVFIDNNTHLMWQDNTEAKTTKLVLDEAISYCENLRLNEFYDWYLPQMHELKTLSKHKQYLKNIYVKNIKLKNLTIHTSAYWSSEILAPEEGIFVDLNDGEYYIHANPFEKSAVRCVRKLKMDK